MAMEHNITQSSSSASSPFLLHSHHHPSEADPSLLRVQMRALSWALEAKDHAIASLTRNLNSASHSSDNHKQRLAEMCLANERLELEVKQSRSRERELERQLLEAMRRIEYLEIAEERLASQLSELEAEALEAAMEHRRVTSSLLARLHHMEARLGEAMVNGVKHHEVNGNCVAVKVEPSGFEERKEGVSDVHSDFPTSEKLNLGVFEVEEEGEEEEQIKKLKDARNEMRISPSFIKDVWRKKLNFGCPSPYVVPSIA